MVQGHLLQPSWQSHLRAILAIARKDWLHFKRYPLNALFRIIQPIMWITPIYFLGKSFATGGTNAGFASYAGTNDYMSFILIGTILSSYISSVFWGMGFSLKEDMDSGVLESNWLLPLPRVLFLIGQTVASITITTINGLLVLVLGWLLFGFQIHGNILPAVLVMVPMLIALYGFGFAFAGLVLLLKEANTLVDVSDFVVSMLSGSRFPVQVLPRLLLPLALALPLTYGYDAVRGLLIGSHTLLPIGIEVGILLVAMVLMTLLGSAVFRRIERRSRRLGTIGMH